VQRFGTEGAGHTGTSGNSLGGFEARLVLWLESCMQAALVNRIPIARINNGWLVRLSGRCCDAGLCFPYKLRAGTYNALIIACHYSVLVLRLLRTWYPLNTYKSSGPLGPWKQCWAVNSSGFLKPRLSNFRTPGFRHLLQRRKHYSSER
jgi:hypothetical protein